MGRYPTFLVADYVDVLRHIYHWSIEDIERKTGLVNLPLRGKHLERYPNDRIVLRLIVALDELGYFKEHELSFADHQYRQQLQLPPPVTTLRMIIAELFNSSSVEEFLQCAVRRFNSLSEANRLWYERTETSVRICHQYYYEEENFSGPQRFFMFLILKLRQVFNVDVCSVRVQFSAQGTRDAPGFTKRTGCAIENAGEFSFIEVGGNYPKYTNPAHNRLTQIAIGESLDELMEPVENDLVDSVTRILERNLGDSGRSLDIEATASFLGMSRATLHRRLAEKGVSFKALRSQSRFNLAARLLRNTSQDITSISALLGYSELSSFCRAFKIANDCSPKAYRCLHQKE
ncbi:AraC family transcriptional regulator [Oxalobacteraceae bacterium OTU3CAMAD1]|nr:AraC family transcriptional regulator [Oxalobacteraceae bacterium OTU3CAMAD1]